MYLIKRISGQRGNIVARDGLRLSLLDKPNRMKIIYHWFGNTVFKIDEKVDVTKVFNNNDWFWYISDYKFTDTNAGYKETFFSILEPDEIEGYILYFERERIIPDLKELVETNGERLFWILPNEMAVVLKEGQYLKFADKIIKVIDNRLFVEL